MSHTMLQIRSASGAKKVPLDNVPLTIGRAPTNRLAVQDERLSRFHCVIELVDGDVRVTDLSSRNGTKVNGEKIEGTAVIRPGDVVRVGGLEITLMPAKAAAGKPVRAGKGAGAGGEPRGSLPIPDMTDDPSALAFLDGKDEPDLGAAVEAMEEADAEEESSGDEADITTHLRRLRQMNDVLPDQRTTEAALSLINARNQPVKLPPPGEETSAQGVTSALRLLLLLCARTGASDIHFEPRQNDYKIRIRVDGMMVDAIQLPASIGSKLGSVVKILSDIDIAQKSVVQEGHFSAQAPDRRVDYRVSFTPAVHGQKLVIRVLDLATTPRHLRELGLPRWMFETIKSVLKQDGGMLIVCGPTGSGKTTTLYAGVRDIDINKRNVITIEDPVEYHMEGVTQIPINEEQGNTFSHLLRSMLRQDPDVILLGEVRDGETARIAMQAAMTGHLVLTTVHAKNAIGTIFRLLDLGIEPYLVASALNLVLAQRLVRKLCEHCRVPVRLTPEHMRKLGTLAEGVTQIYFPGNCPRCLGTGYHGRLALYELLHVTDDMRDIILKTPTMQDLRNAMRNTLFASLRESGMKLVTEGITSLDEIERVVGTEGM